MTTMAVVKKNGYAAIAADTLTTFGNLKESAEYIINHRKIFKYRDNYIGLSGWGASQHALEDFLSTTRKKISFAGVGEIFRAGLMIHRELKENYFLRPEDGDSDAFETSRSDILIVNPNGIFALTEYRYVQEFSRFYSYGSGSEYALGAMFVIYEDESKSAEDIARSGVRAGIEFDDGSGLPIDCFTVKLRD
jgi:ATP-dependent protease HslVU (ClpYQ) peptidase subunit